MKSIGIVRRIDDLGRVVIPKETRRVMGIKEGDPVEIFIDGDMVCVKKYQESNSCSLCGAVNHLLQVDGTTICMVCARKVVNVMQGN